MQYIKVCDVSLSEIYKSNINLTFKEKLEIAKKLDDLGFESIEIGPIFDTKADEVLLKTISTCIQKTEIGAVCACNENDIEKTYHLISNAKKKKIIIEAPISSVKMEYSFGLKPQKVLQLIINSVNKAKTLCENVEVSLIDATRAENDFLYDIIKNVVSLGISNITVSDDVGTLDSAETKKFFDDIYKNIDDCKKINLFFKCSNDFNMATGSMISSFSSGVKGVKLCALNNGNYVNFESFLKTMDCVGAKKGFDIKINKTCVNRVVSQISNISSAKSNNIEAEDNSTSKNISSKVTIAELNKILKSRGYDLSNDDSKKVLEEIKRIGEKKELTIKDLDSIVAVTALQVPSTYMLESYAVHCSNVVSSTANVTLKNGEKIINGIAIGNGSIDSAFLALENALGRHFDLDEFVVNAVTQGKEAMGETIIKLRHNGNIFSGRGVSTDIVGASIRAYLNAVNKIVYEEKE